MKKSYLNRLINNLREDFPIQAVNLLVYLQDFFYKIPPPQNPSEKYILLIRTDLLGDFIIWLNALKFIAEKYKSKGYKIILAGNEIWLPLAEKTKIFDIIIPLNRKKYFKDFSYRKNILNEINKFNIEYIFQTAHSRDFAVADSLARNIQAENKIAFVRKPEAEYSVWNLLSSLWYTKLIKPGKKNIFEFYRVSEFLNFLDIKTETYTTDILQYFQKDNHAKKYFVVLPGANAARRCLEPQKFVSIINQVIGETGWECILCGSKSEAALGNIIEANVNKEVKNLVQNLIGKTSLIELGNILTNAQLVLGNETGTLHFAAALNAPSVSALGGGHFKRFMPYDGIISANIFPPEAAYKEMKCFNCHWRCIYTAEKNEIVPCISQLSSEYILESINKVISINLQAPSVQK